jgi:acyl-CoA thioesterase-1
MLQRFHRLTKWLSILLALAIYSYDIPAIAHTKTILVFGDSLSAGYGLERGQEWPSLLQRRLSDNKLGYNVVNHSISGETTSGGLSRFQQSLQQTSPDIVILELGANDGLRGLSVKAMRNNLQSMIDLARSMKIQVVLVGMRLPINYGEAYTKLFHRQFVQLAEQNQLPFIPFLMDKIGAGLEMYQADGLHPTARAQTQMMDNVWQTLRYLLEPV